MKPLIHRVIAVCCTLTLLLTFSACKVEKIPASGTNTSAVPSTTELVSVSESTPVPTTAQATTAAPEIATTLPAVSQPKVFTNAEILALYNEAYNKTKASGTFLGTDNMSMGDLILSGKVNSNLTKIAQLAIPLFSNPKKNNQLSPQAPGYETSKLTEADLEQIEIIDNGTSYDIKIVPIETTNPTLGSAGAGRFFDLMPDLGPLLDQMGIKWTQGTAADNAKTNYKDGYGEFTINKESGLITSANYVNRVKVLMNNGKLGITINNASLTLEFQCKFPS